MISMIHLKKHIVFIRIRFALTLCKKEPGEEVFYRHDDKQYISAISTEDKKVKEIKLNFKNSLFFCFRQEYVQRNK